MHELYLSTETRLRIVETTVAPAQRWMEIAHTGIVRPALILIAGECAEFSDGVSILAGTRLMLRYSAAHNDLSADGAELLLELRDDSEITMLLGRLPVPADTTGLTPRIAIFDLTPFAGKVCRLRVHCLPGSEDDACGDWIAIYDLAIGSEEHLSVLRARAFKKERTSNEIAHFTHVYEHSMYTSETNDRTGTLPAVICVPLADVVRNASHSIQATSGLPFLPFLAPAELFAPIPTNAFEYAHRLLGAELQSSAPMFEQRLLDRCMKVETQFNRPVRILSLCSGAARIEAQFASGVVERAEWTLLDISEGLLQAAANNFPAGVSPRLIVADLNEIEDFGERFDVVMCVSALHHIVELERVAEFIQQVLVDDGEFWSIGEAIGRSGNRLWQEEYAVANSFFRRLPERLRRNRRSMKPDQDLPDADYSEATFEGIRSDEIEPLLSHRLEPVQLYRRNCFLWRLVDLAYADNYDLSDAEDIAWIQAAVRSELAHYRAGGRPTELHGVFRKRVL